MTVNSGRPLFMELHFFAPHDPSDPAPRHAGTFATAPLPRDARFNEKNVKDKPNWLRKFQRMGPGLISKQQTRYRNRLDTLLAVDEAVEALVQELGDRNLLDETYIIFTSDNGYMQGQHRLHQGKFVPYEPSTRVPLLIRGPGIPAGAATKELVSNVDIVPTILDIADASAGVTQDGRSLLPFAFNPRARTTRPILFETGRPIAIADPASAGAAGGRGKASPRIVKNNELDGTAQLAGRVIKPPKYRGIRTGRYMLAKYSDGSRELYDMAKDRLQLKSVFKNRRYKPVKKWLLRRLARLTPCVGATCNVHLGKPPKVLKKSQLKKLRKKAKKRKKKRRARRR